MAQRHGTRAQGWWDFPLSWGAGRSLHQERCSRSTLQGPAQAAAGTRRAPGLLLVLAPRGVSRALWETRGILRTNQTLYKTKGTFIYRTAAGPARGPGVCSRQPHPRVPDPPGQEETAPLKKSGEVSQVKGWRRAGERGATSTPCPPCGAGNKGGTRGTHWVFSARSQGTLFTPSTTLCPGKGLAHGCEHSPRPQLTSMGKALALPSSSHKGGRAPSSSCHRRSNAGKAAALGSGA